MQNAKVGIPNFAFYILHFALFTRLYKFCTPFPLAAMHHPNK